MLQFNVYEKLKHALSAGSIKNIAGVDETILPYKAEFLADPFIFYYNKSYHIFCEVYVRKGDKRIAHLKSDSRLQHWHWVADVITGLDLSFPAVYEITTAQASEVMIIPQISKTFKLIAYRYQLENETALPAEIAWEIDLPVFTNDQIIVQHPETRKNYLVYSSRDHTWIGKKAGLFAAEIEHPFDVAGKPIVHKPRKITGKNVRTIIQKLFNQPRLSFRPAGSILQVSDETFTIPIQVKKSGKYGELLAFVFVKWENFQVQNVEFFEPENLLSNAERMHHLSWTSNEEGGLVFCYDFIQSGGGERWELQVFTL